MFEYIADDDALARLADRLERADWLAFDTEFVRESTFWPRLCLLQVADRHGLIACIDPLSVSRLDPLLDAAWRDGVIKVFHAASQDLELLYRERSPMPGPLFDTQVAAALLGDDVQVGYASAVEAHTGVQLAKAHTRTDWSRRPLTGSELDYAADDVRHLPALYDALHAELVARGRLDWALHETASMADPARYAPDLANAWRRVKGVRDLDAAGMAALQRLAAWREQTAMRTDRPRRWILGDEQLVLIARSRPGGKAALAAIDGMPPAVLRKHSDALLDALHESAVLPGAGPEVITPLERSERDLIDTMMKRVRARAEELSIAAPMLATRRDCEALVRGQRPPALLHGWRRELIGEDLLALAEAAPTER